MSILLSALRKVVARDAIHLLYHSFLVAPIPHIAPLYACKTADDLERDLVYLKTHFHLISHDDLVANRETGRALPPEALSLSFDDGFAECFTVARPLLLKHKIPASFFVCQGFVDNHGLMYRNKVALCLSRISSATPREFATMKSALGTRLGVETNSPEAMRRWLLGLGFADRDAINKACECLKVDVAAFLRDRRPYMSRDEVAQLHADGFTIGGHTKDHPELSKLSDWSEVRSQVGESCNYAREISGRTRVPFAFPFSGRNLPRGGLTALRAEFGIDLMYDTNDLMKDESFIVNRIWCDKPDGASHSKSNLPAVIRRAYALEPARTVRRRVGDIRCASGRVRQRPLVRD